jgi:hypothetical protein
MGNPNQEYYQQYLFAYNPYTEIWHCVDRDKIKEYYNKGESYLSAKDTKDIFRWLKEENKNVK